MKKSICIIIFIIVIVLSIPLNNYLDNIFTANQLAVNESIDLLRLLVLGIFLFILENNQKSRIVLGIVYISQHVFSFYS